jgi:hypothetical protein
MSDSVRIVNLIAGKKSKQYELEFSLNESQCSNCTLLKIALQDTEDNKEKHLIVRIAEDINVFTLDLLYGVMHVLSGTENDENMGSHGECFWSTFAEIGNYIGCPNVVHEALIRICKFTWIFIDETSLYANAMSAIDLIQRYMSDFDIKNSIGKDVSFESIDKIHADELISCSRNWTRSVKNSEEFDKFAEPLFWRLLSLQSQQEKKQAWTLALECENFTRDGSSSPYFYMWNGYWLHLTTALYMYEHSRELFFVFEEIEETRRGVEFAEYRPKGILKKDKHSFAFALITSEKRVDDFVIRMDSDFHNYHIVAPFFRGRKPYENKAFVQDFYKAIQCEHPLEKELEEEFEQSERPAKRQKCQKKVDS